MVEEVKEEHGFNLSLKMIDLRKSSWDYHENKKVIKEEKYSHLEDPLDEIIEENPEYGARKIKPELEEQYGYCHGRKLIYELLRMFGLKKEQQARKTSKSGYRKAIEEAGESANLVKDLEDISLFEVVYTDFTDLSYGGGTRKAKLMPIIGHASKLVFGWAIGRRRSGQLAQQALESALETFEEVGADPTEMILHQDRDSVYTGEEWVNQIFVQEGMSPSYSMKGARGNTYMESFNGHFKNPVSSIFETSETLCELRENVKDRVKYWNQKRRHASIDNRTPMEYVEENR